MYGFGGHARLIAKGVPRDGAGRMWLMLHQDPHKTEWETSFLLKNFGDLKAFIKIKPISKGEFLFGLSRSLSCCEDCSVFGVLLQGPLQTLLCKVL